MSNIVSITDVHEVPTAEFATAPQATSEGEWAAEIKALPSMPCSLVPVSTSPTAPSHPPIPPQPFILGPGNVLKASLHPALDLNDFLIALVDLQRRRPADLHRITTLELDGTQPIACRSLHDQVGELKLPKLRELVIEGAAMPPETFRKLLCNHKKSLCRLTIKNTALTLPKDDIFSGYDAWIGVLVEMRHGLKKVQHIEIGGLFWRWQGPSPHSPTKPSSQVHSKLVLPQKKYHLRVQKSWNGKPMQWRLEQDGMWAELQVYDALGAFTRELTKLRDEK